MRYMREQGRRRSVRLTGYDYSQANAYFVTLCTFSRAFLFGNIVDDEMELNCAGRIAHEEWLRSSEVRSNVQLDTFQIMPNHFHAIVIITHALPDNINVGAHSRAPLSRQPKSLGSLIAGFKSAATKQINQLRGTPGVPVWQRNYYERVIRNERELEAIRQYIVDNPAKSLS